MVNRNVLDKLGFKRIQEGAGITEYRSKKNGLKVLLKEDHKAPVATFLIVYRVGSRDEGAGWTGSAHYFEHLMFKGTRAFDPLQGNGVFELTDRIGAEVNANTYYDRTLYYEVVPSEHLGLCMRLEADRMRNLKNRVSDRDSEMTVVRNEFERGENNPGSALYKEVMGAAYREHQYTWPVIGYRSDVEGVSMDRMVSSLYDGYYWPNNATVIIVGDFDSAEVLAQVDRYFGRIPRSSKPIPQTYTVEPRQEGERRVQVRRMGGQELIKIGYHVPEAAHADTRALSVAAHILGSGGASSRLYKALVEAQKCTGASASVLELRDPGMLFVDASVAPGVSLAEVESIIDAEIERLSTDLVSEDELSRVRAMNRKGTTLSLDDPKNLADLLAEAEAVADWTWSIKYDDAYDAVTAEDIRRVAKEYLRKDNRTVGQFIPTEPEPRNSDLGKLKVTPPKARRERSHRQVRTKIDIKPASTNYGERTVSRTLSNGLTVRVIRQGRGSVAVSGAVLAGDHFAPTSNSMLPTIVSDMLKTGTQRFSKEAIASTLARMSANLRLNCAQNTVNFTQVVAKEDLDTFIDLLSDVLQRPAFDEGELAKIKPMYRAYFARAKSDTGDASQRAFRAAVYPAGHPLHQATLAEVAAQSDATNAADLRAFHSTYFCAKNTMLTIVGDVDTDALIELLEKSFGGWQSGERATVVVPAVATAGATNGSNVVKLPIPGKANVDILIGHATTLNRVTSEDMPAARVANMILGGDTISGLLGAEVRVKEGLTYGIYSSFGSGEEQLGAAPYSISLSVNPDNVEKALGLVRKVVDKYAKDGVGEQELTDAISKVLGQRVVAMRSGAAIAATLRDITVLGYEPSELDAISARYASLTKADVDAAIRKYLTLDGAVTVIAGSVA